MSTGIRKEPKTYNRLRRLGLQLLLLMSIYTISRTIFALINQRYFPQLTSWSFLKSIVVGMRYDFAAICMLNGLYFALAALPVAPLSRPLGQKILQSLFVIANSIALLFELSDWAYFPYNHRRATADVLELIGRKGDFINILPTLLRDYWYVLPAAILVILLLSWLNKKIVAATPLPAAQARKALPWLLWIGVLGISFLGIRGGLQYIPIGLRNAVQDAPDPALAPLVLNTPFSIISSAATPQLQPRHWMEEGRAWHLTHPVNQLSRGPMQKNNVVVLILESFSKEFTGGGGGVSYTPFLDSLATHSYNCTNAWANGLRSAEGLPAIVAGIPTLMNEPFTTSAYGANRIDALAGLLAGKGYETAFFHGGENGTMSLDVLAAASGFRQYYGRREYNNNKDYDGAWGIRDMPFLQFAVQRLSAMKEPFCTAIFTLSSHPPYSLPAEKKDYYPKGTLPIHPTISYTDDALREFFKTAATQPWFANTLFVITADHAAPEHGGGKWGEGMWRFSIPLLYYSPGDERLAQQQDSTLTQQIDILPTVLHYLQYPDSFFAFGKSLWDTTATSFAVQYYGGSYSWLSGGYLLNFADTSLRSCYRFPMDTLQQHNMLPSPGAPPAAVRQFRAFLQTYTEALRSNRMSVHSYQRAE